MRIVHQTDQTIVFLDHDDIVFCGHLFWLRSKFIIFISSRCSVSSHNTQSSPFNIWLQCQYFWDDLFYRRFTRVYGYDSPDSVYENLPNHPTSQATVYSQPDTEIVRLFWLRWTSAWTFLRWNRGFSMALKEKVVAFCGQHLDARRCQGHPVEISDQAVHLVVDIHRSMGYVHLSNAPGDEKLFLVPEKGERWSRGWRRWKSAVPGGHDLQHARSGFLRGKEAGRLLREDKQE